MIRRTSVIAYLAVMLGGLLLAVSGARASTEPCVAASGGTGMGGTGIIARGGTGMGGTGSPANGSAMQLAGRVMFSHGRIEARSDGHTRLLTKGDAICVGDTIQSAKTASAQIMMVDHELIAVRPETRIRIDRYAFHRTSNDHIMLSLFEGACRIVSGEIGKRVPQNDLVSTPLAIIGIRGTDHEVAIVPPAAGIAPAGVYDKVNRGVTYIRTDKGSIDIHPNEVGFVASQQGMPRLLVNMPAFYNNPSLPLTSGNKEHGGEQGEYGNAQGTEGSFEHSGMTSGLESGLGTDAVSGAGEPSPSSTTETVTGSEPLSPPATQSLPEPQSLPESPIPAPSSPEADHHEMMTSPLITTSPSEH